MKHMHLKETTPFQVQKDATIAEVLSAMANTGFQGRNLGTSFKIWQKAIYDNTSIFLGLAGAMVPAGMRKVISFLIEKKLIDCIVSTGANLFHDIHETLGNFHYKGFHNANDTELFDKGIDRIYDTFAFEQEFRKTDKFIADFANGIEKKPYTTPEFLYKLGEVLDKVKKIDGILTTAFRNHLPIFCPAIADSSICIALASGLAENASKIQFDMVKDVEISAKMAAESPSTGVVYIGGGTPKNFIQQTEVTASIMDLEVHGHKYAIQFTGDSPHWGGLSGCTFEEAQSWGKISVDATKVMTFCDATIALPIIASGLSQVIEKSPRQYSATFDKYFIF